MHWIDVCFKIFNLIVYKAGKRFTCASFQACTNMLHIWTKYSFIESGNCTNTEHGYHPPIRCAFENIINKAPDIGKEKAVQMVVKGINDSTGSNEIVLALLVFEAHFKFRIPARGAAPSTFKDKLKFRSATTVASQ